MTQTSMRVPPVDSDDELLGELEDLLRVAVVGVENDAASGDDEVDDEDEDEDDEDEDGDSDDDDFDDHE